MIGGTVAMIYLVGSPSRSRRFAAWVTRTGNRIISFVSRRKRVVIHTKRIEKFFNDMHVDYLELKKEKRILIKPYLWGLAFTAGDVALYWITFWALGSPINPAPILIAYGLANIAAFIVITPGGTGAFEAIMVSFLTISGTNPGIVIAGILLTRVILLLGTIGLGYFFYQHALVKYGKPKSTPGR